MQSRSKLPVEQLSIMISTTVAQTAANLNATAEKAGAAAPERAAAEQTVDVDTVEQDAAIIADAEAGATVNNLLKKIKRMQAAFDEATATINYLEAENKRTLLLLAEAKAAATAKVFVPGYNIPMAHAEHLQALQRQIHWQYLQGMLYAQAIPAADRAIMAATANLAETAMASGSPVPANVNGPSWERHIRSQPRASTAKSEPATYAQVAEMNSAPPSSPTVKRSTRTKDDSDGRDHSANAASASTAAGPELTRSPSVQPHEPAENPAAAAA